MPHTDQVKRGVRLSLTVGLVVVDVLLMSVAASMVTLHYSLPVPGANLTKTAVFGPGIAATVVAGLALVAGLGWLIWNVIVRPSTRWWWIPVGLTFLALLVTVIVGTLTRPVF